MFVGHLRLSLFVCLVLVLGACDRQPLEDAVTPSAEGATATIAPPPSPTNTRAPAETEKPVPTETAVPVATVDVRPVVTETPAPTATPTVAPLDVTHEVTFELLAQEGGQVHSVDARGSVAYVGAGPRLVVVDAADPANPQPTGRSDVLPGLVRAVLVQGEIVYAGAGRHLLALDVSDESEMRVAGQVELPGDVTHLIHSEGTIYAGGAIPTDPYSAEATGFLASVEVGGPGSVALRDTAALPYAVNGLALAGDRLVAAQRFAEPGEDDLITFGLSRSGDLGDPVPVSLPIQDDVYSLYSIGDTLLVGGSMKLHALGLGTDLEDGLRLGNQLERLWTVEASPDLFLPMIESMAVAGDIVFVVGNVPAGAYIPERLAVPAPEPLSGEAGSSSSPLAALSEDVLFVAEGNALEIYDVGQPGEITQVGVYEPPATFVSSLAIGQTAGGETLHLYAGSPFDAEPEEIFTFRLPGLEPLGHLAIEPAETETSVGQGALFDLALNGDRAYAVTGDGIYQIDAANPAAPRVTASYPFAEEWLNPRGLVVLNGIVYLGKELETHLRVSAVTFGGAGAPRQVAELDLPGNNLRALAGDGDRLTVTSEQNWLHIIDVSGGEIDPLRSLRLPGQPGRALAVNGGLVATSSRDELLLIDASMPEEPVIVATVTLPGVHDLAFRGDLLLATAGERLLAFDVSDPANSRAVGAIELPSLGYFRGAELAVSAETIVVGNGPMGIWVLQAATETGEVQN